jgi:predicted hotdog family 3-hydroxylacyl-ACP dehydratase
MLSVAAGMMALVQVLCLAQRPPPMPAGQLLREVVYNELQDHQGHGYWRYWIERYSPRESRLEDQIETSQGPITRLTRTNGLSLSPGAQQLELARLQHMISSPKEQASHRQDYDDDEKRIGHIVALLPDAFLYEYDGDENGCQRLSFRPNPDYPGHSLEARILHAASGTLWINLRYKRLARLDAHLDENVDLAFGILGRLYKGGWFRLQRTQVSATDWKTERLEVHMAGRALLFKSISREASELRRGFVAVPAGINLAQAMTLFDATLAQAQVQPQIQTGTQAETHSSQVTAAALVLRR